MNNHLSQIMEIFFYSDRNLLELTDVYVKRAKLHYQSAYL